MKTFFTLSISALGFGVIGFLWYRKKTLRKYKIDKVELKIHNTIVGYVIGRCGGTIKNIQSKSGAKIKFVASESSSEYISCIIKGSNEDVKLAVNIINDIVKKRNEDEIQVPILSDSENNLGYDIGEIDSYSDKLMLSISDVMNEFYDLSQESSDEIYKLNGVLDFVLRHTQKLQATRADGLIPVYVCAVSSPQQFWVQAIQTNEHTELDRLTDELAEFYKTNPQLNFPPNISDVKSGQIYAFFFDQDNRWYRVEVVQVAANNKGDVLNTMVDLYFLDFGESFYKTVKDLRKLPDKFLSLNFQAVQCGLANIKPVGDAWSEEAINFFYDITHTACWYTLMARIEADNNGCHPLLKLIDTNSEIEVNIADELIKNGYASYLIINGDYSN